MIKLIDINKIKNHPENPRKNLGDLTELADSIKQSGILQNLTLVPANEDEEGIEYYALIGNRRLGASKLAGLKEVPCAIAVDMDRKTQIATMLLENMQRSDLTVYEQAQGFQMMIDLGETVNNISDKTGFSERTVQRRVKLLELDQEKFKDSVDRGVTLMEFAKLSKITNLKKRNEILEYAGTSDFNWRLRSAIDDQEKKVIKQKLVEKISRFAINIKKVNQEELKIKRLTHLSYSENSLEKEIEFEEGKDYIFEIENYCIEIYENIFGQTETGEERQRREEEERRKARKAEMDIKVDEIKRRTESLREDFVSSLTNTKLMKYMGEILLLGTEARSSIYMWQDKSYIRAFGLDVEEDDFEFKELEEDFIKRPALSLLRIIYYEELKNASYFNWRGEHSEDKALDMLYDLLEKVGYEMSEEEKEVQDGSHRIFEEIDS